MIEKEYYIPSNLQWKIWNQRLELMNKEIREYRITSITMSTIVWALVITGKWFGEPNSMSFVVSMTLGMSGFLWAFCYLYTLQLNNFLIQDVYWRDEPYDLEHESYAMILKELEYKIIAKSRRLKLIKMLISISIMMTIASIFSVIILSRSFY
ncbi:MAG: hypothetical protein CVV44_12585 [Spirochaetae bacterium HGW-Spirochaetae-1]|jgi:hypothetical protein|nr:MAG: hypothetical protein CVV44_12585 [Spirochaetae bacterium HGW-Spirochaetae-1]